MSGTTFQNVQRGLAFMFFLITVYYFVIITIALIKKEIDPVDDESGGEGYKDKEHGESGENTGAADNNPYKMDKNNDSEANFDSSAIKADTIKDDDPTIIKLVKKTRYSEVFLLPFLVIAPLNMLTGTSKAFCMVCFFFILVLVVLFNLIKLHRKSGEVGHKCLNVVLDNAWLMLLFFMFVNQWGADPVRMPYNIL